MVKQSRRDFIKKSVLGAAGLTFAMDALPGCNKAVTPSRALEVIGLQTFTVVNQLREDYKGTLQKIAEMGYNALEMGGYMGPSLQEFKAFLAELGLNPLSGGASMIGLRDELDKTIEESLQMGKKYLICFWPWVDSAENKTINDWKKMAESLNKIGEKVKQAGLVFAYHNHDIEFKLTEGQIPYDVILENTDPALVGMEIDLYWIKKGGREPVPYFEKYPGRFPVWHIKDMDDSPEQDFACVGQGIIDFPAIFAHADKAGMKHVFVEHDRPADPMECARVSCEYLKQLRY